MAHPFGTQPDPRAKPLTLALADVIAERVRQQTAEGWTPDHDDQHKLGEMARAAAAYALDGQQADLTVRMARGPLRNAGWVGLAGLLWPWDLDWWKPTDRRRNLVKAAALIIAEIERIDRAEELLGEGQ